ncbi:hypothetical protein L3X38_041495 [Prunus dulcis]|uniref:Uncharacterized protein n=1 Tax=Prunus dulcis TaxID=3755 RepID=A0AAD4YJ99_PRUDU|nr:hypothetical protein L3X38_041495 [Prunus dulcis]
MISTISGGPTLEGISNRSMKQYVRAAQYTQRIGTESSDDPRDETSMPHAQSAEDLETIILHENHPDQCMKIGTTLTATHRFEFIQFLRHHFEVFVWSYNNMPGIFPEVICHKLTISLAYKPVRWKRRSYDTERYEAMKAEVDKLRAIDFIREATYPVWLANSVMVRKENGRWRMCQDYTDLNKACSKDNFPSPRIDQLIDATNAGATYQQLVNRIFAKHIGSTMEVYVDEMLRGIEVNLEKIKALIDMKMPKTQKDIQSPTRRVVALTRLISKATDKCALFFKALKGSKQYITWTAECDLAFQELKSYISKAQFDISPR